MDVQEYEICARGEEIAALYGAIAFGKPDLLQCWEKADGRGIVRILSPLGTVIRRSEYPSMFDAVSTFAHYVNSGALISMPDVETGEG